MAKTTKGAKPMAGSMTPLQPMIRGSKMVDPRMAPCGDNKIDTPDADGDEAGEY